MAKAEIPTFPNSVVVQFHLLPPEPFGTSKSGGHAATRAQAASLFFDANTGKHHIESKVSLNPLEVIIDEPDARIELNGQILAISRTVDSVAQLEAFIETFYFLIPILLNLEFADPPFVERVEGRIGELEFRWELVDWKSRFEITDQEHQEGALIRAWARINPATERTHRRLLAAVSYFYNGMRLLQVAHAPGEFVAEAILNFAKVLEVLFPADSTGTITAARKGLDSLGYSTEDQESMYIPALALRNRIDIGHVDLTIFEQDQLKVIHEYTEDAAAFFKELLGRVFDRMADGSFLLALGEATIPEREDRVLIERLQAAKAARAV